MNQRFAFVVLVLGVVACTTEPEVLRVEGSWSYSMTMTVNGFVGGPYTCETYGTLFLRETSNGLRGTRFGDGGECDTGRSVTTSRVNVDGGEVIGQSIWFTTFICEYTGTITGAPAQVMAGSLTCGSGTLIPMDVGTWTATRSAGDAP
jgi:hypothetical protein